MTAVTRRVAIGLAAHLAGTPGLAGQAAEGDPYHEPDLLRRLPFGSHSHWLRPWRAMTETRSAAALREGLGVVLGHLAESAPRDAIKVLARSGIRTARIEIPWGDVEYKTETRFRSDAAIRRVLGDCRRHGIRPLILLNSHHGEPVPARRFEGRALASAYKGARSLQLTSAEPIRPGLTGLCDLTDYRMAEVLVTGMRGKEATLSKPLPVDLAADARIHFATLRYEPFAASGSTRMEATLAGWLRYVDLVGTVAAEVLTSPRSADRGFDLEVWNELTFGSDFLSLANYYDPAPALDEEAIRNAILQRTARHIEEHPARFAGAVLVNGFSNTLPWPAAAEQPARVGALGKHPYPPAPLNFPQDERPTTALGPDGEETGIVPSYRAYLPEHYGTAMQTETVLRDLSTAGTEIYGMPHGRNARRISGTIMPVAVWITEIGLGPLDLGIEEPRAADLARAKFGLRALLFWLGLGVDRVCLFRAYGEPKDFALLPIGPISAPGALLAALPRLLSLVCGDAAAAAFDLRPLSFRIVAEEKGPRLFGTDASTAVHAVDTLVLLPFQSQHGRFAIAVYAMGRDIAVSLPAIRLQIVVEGFDGRRATARLADPMGGEDAPCEIIERRTNAVVLRLSVHDWPRVLVLRETEAGSE